MKSRVFIALSLCVITACNRDPNVAKQKYLESGNKYFEKAQFKQAELMYKKAIDKDRKFGEGYYRLALAELQMGDFNGAAANLHRTVDLSPENIDAHAKLIDMYLAFYARDPRKPQQYLNEVRSLGDRLLKRDPQSYDGLRVQGYLALAEKDVKSALSYFRSADKVKPGNAEMAVAIAQALQADGQQDEAERYARSYLASHKDFGQLYDFLYLQYARANKVAEAEEVMKQKVANRPKDSGAKLELAGHYFRIHKMPEMKATLDQIASNRQDYPNGHQLVGDFYTAVRDYNSAASSFQSGLNQASDKEKALYEKKLAEVYLLQNKPQEAEKMVQAILKDDPKDGDGIAMRAGFAIQSGDKAKIQSAIEDLQGLVARFPDNPLVRFNLGRAYLAKGGDDNVEKGRLALEEAIKVRREFVPAHLALAQLYQGRREWGKSLQTADELLQMQPLNLAGKLLRTNALMNMGELKQSRLELGELLKAQPDLPDAVFQMAVLNGMEKDYKAGEAGFTKLRNMGDPRGLVGVVETHVAMKQFPQALSILDEELKKDGSRTELVMARANTLALGGRYDEAIATYNQVLAKDPGNVDVLLRIAETYRLRGDIEGAIQAFRKATEAKPNHVPSLLQLAQVLDTAGRKDEAKPIYERILRLESDNPVACNNLAYILADQGTDLDNALNLVNRALQKYPKNPEISDTLGYVYIKKKLTVPAIQLYEQITTDHPANAMYRYHLGMALAQSGDKAKAKKELEAALKNSSKGPVQEQIRQLLSQVS